MLPMGDLRRIDAIGTGEFIDRFEPFERFECHTGFELGTVLFPLCRHRPSSPLPLPLTQHSILITCPVFGVHYKDLCKSIPIICIKEAIFEMLYFVVQSLEGCSTTTTEYPGNSSPCATIHSFNG